MREEFTRIGCLRTFLPNFSYALLREVSWVIFIRIKTFKIFKLSLYTIFL